MNETQQPRPVGMEFDETPLIDKLVAALAKAQAAFTHADPSRTAQLTKDGKKRKYATLADVMDAARPHLSANGLAVVQHPSTTRDGIILTTWLMHESGQWMRSRMEFPRPDSDRMSLIQALGTALSYARRYAYAAIVGVAVEDDDGESAERPGQRYEEDHSREPATPEVFPRFGPAAGQPIRGADAKHLETYANAMVGALADPERARFRAANEALLDAIRKEQERQRPSSGGPTPPPSADETKERQAGIFYAQAVRLGKDAGWEQADVGKWLKESRKRNGKTEVTAEDVEEFRKHLSPPEPGGEG